MFLKLIVFKFYIITSYIFKLYKKHIYFFYKSIFKNLDLIIQKSFYASFKYILSFFVYLIFVFFSMKNLMYNIILIIKSIYLYLYFGNNNY